MRGFEPIVLDAAELRRELQDLENFLGSVSALKERDHVAPFFKAHRQLSAQLGTANSDVQLVDRLAVELDLFGDFQCDIAAGDAQANAFTLVEFEDAKPYSIFRAPEKGRPMRRWSSRFEHGFSQLVDWAWRLDTEGTSAAIRRIFEDDSPSVHLLLVAGRRADLNEGDYKRLRWRSKSMSVGRCRLSCWTFDDVLSTLRRRLDYVSTTPTP